MGTTYALVPLAEVVEGNFTWLESLELPLPKDLGLGRFPTPAELLSILEAMNEYVVGRNVAENDLFFYLRRKNSKHDVPGDPTIRVYEYAKDFDDHMPRELEFYHTNLDDVLQITKNLSNKLGPFLVIRDGEEFFVV